MTLTCIVLLAVVLDRCLGEADNACHPLVAFGRWASQLDTRYFRPQGTPVRQKIIGCMALLAALLISLIGLTGLLLPTVLQPLFDILVLYFCIGAHSLKQHALAIHQALMQQDLTLARQRVGCIVSRQTDSMDLQSVQRAAIESVLENGADAIFAPLFWFVLLGPVGALLYRLTNTLDAMWGYKTPRYLNYGWAAARLDDGMNCLPARLTALSYALLSETGAALKAWQQQASWLESPNAGPVMTAGAGGLGLKLGGPACYHGQIKLKPWFGGERLPQNQDICLACRLVERTLLLWLALIALVDSFA